MQFHNPEVLIALFLLIIPVIVHLFQLRRFRRENFTNVKFLRRLTQQTRKSSRIKKLLVLTTRLLLLCCIIFAFSRPYFPQEDEISGERETVIFLDNSYSMQAQGERGSLLDRSKQELLEYLPEEHNITLITNSEIYQGVSRQDIQEIDYSPLSTDLSSIFLKAGSSFSGNKTAHKKLLLISNFRKGLHIPSVMRDSLLNTFLLPLKPQNINNVSIDSLYFTRGAPGTGTLTVMMSYSGNGPGSIPVSLYDGIDLLGKTSVEFTEISGLIEFPVARERIVDGRLQIEDNGLQFDNSLYFSLNPALPIKVTSINGADAGFLNRIFTEPEFEFAPMEAGHIDYNILSNSQLVVLNEVEDITGALGTTLLNLIAEDVIVVVILPSQPGTGLLDLLKNMRFSGTPVKHENEKLVTGISFEHPLYNDVFDDRVRNFEYPKVQVSFRIIQAQAGILNYEDNSPFLIGAGKNYMFTAPLNRENSNFTQSPLIVPTFYNMGMSALKSPQLYYYLSKVNSFDVPVEISGDRILEIATMEKSFIPRQQNFVNKVSITTDDLPYEPGNYKVLTGDEEITAVSFNIDRSQSVMEYQDFTPGAGTTIINDLDEFFRAAGYKKEVDTLWKWFVTFALIFLVLETLLLKYFK